MTPHYAIAWRDIVDGFSERQIWGRLGWQEVRRRYHRTVIGPFWSTLSIGMFVGGMAFIWAPLFNTRVETYLPYLSAGLVSWSLITALLCEGCTTYTAGIALITQLRFPYMILNYAVIWRNLIVFFHHLVFFVLIMLIFKIPLGWETLLLIPGVLIVVINGAWITVLLGMVSARYRDIPPLVNNLVQILMFATPIFWLADQLSPAKRIFVVDLNYMFHLVDVMRAPMLGKVPSLLSYEVTIGGAIIGWLITFWVYARFRRQIAYWL